jgi:hypothetical protein
MFCDAKSEVLKTASMKIYVSWNMTLSQIGKQLLTFLMRLLLQSSE